MPTTTLTGFTFDGWYTAASGGTKIVSTTKVAITAAQTLYAHWNTASYTITVNPSGGVARKNLSYMKEGSGSNSRITYSVNSSGVITATGNLADNTDNYGFCDNTGPYANLEITNSVFKGYTVTATITSSKGTNLDVGFYKYGNAWKRYLWVSNVGNSGTFTRSNGTTGGNDIVDGTDLYVFRADPNTYQNVATFSNLAIYETDTSYNNTNYTISIPVNHLYYLIPPTRTGYTFNGWTVSGTGSTVSGNILKVGTANTTVTAKWTINTYSVAFNPKGSGETYTTSGSMANQSFTYGTAQALTKNTFTRTGFTFAGWSTSSAANRTKNYDDQQSVSNLTTTNGATVNLYAVWTANKYTITLNAQAPSDKANGGNGTSSIVLYYNNGYYTNNNVNVAIGTSGNPVTVPTAGGYTFRGYYNNQNTNGIVENGTNPSGTQVIGTDGLIKVNSTFFSNAATVYGVWYHNTYNVTYNANGATTGTLPSNTSGLYKSSVTLGTNSMGWANSTYATITFAYDITQYSNVNAYAALSSAPTKPANATVTTYQKWTANGWNTNASGGTSTHYNNGASFAIHYNGATIYAEKKTNGYAYNKVTLPTPAAWTGHTFMGWYTAKTGGTKYGNAGAQVEVQETTTKTITLYARWNYTTYTVKVDATPAGLGTVSGTGTLNDASNGSVATSNVTIPAGSTGAAVSYGTIWTLNAVPSESNEFFKWVDKLNSDKAYTTDGTSDGLTVSITNGTISGTMGSANRQFMAYFRPLDGTIDGTTFYYTVTSESPKTCTLNRVRMSASGVLTIPNEINGYTITAMRNGTSDNDTLTYLASGNVNANLQYNKVADTTTRSYITGLVLNCSSCTNIGAYAFRNCGQLAGSVVIPNSITTIGANAFKSCGKLAGVTLPNALTTIGSDCFLWCGALASVNEIPSTVTTIGSRAFSKTTSLTSLSVNSANANYLSSNGIIYSKNKKTVVSCPSGKTGVWSTNGAINTDILPAGVTGIVAGAFWGSKITGQLIIPSTVTTIEHSVFRECTGINARLVIPATITSIRPFAFQGMSNCPEILFMHSAINTLAFGADSEFTAGKSGVVYMFRDTQSNVTAWGKFTTTHFTNTDYHFAAMITYNGNGGTLNASAVPQYTYNGGTFTTYPANVVSRNYYDAITQWTTAQNSGTGYAVNTEVTSTFTTDQTFWADWRNRGHIYTVTLKHENGTSNKLIFQKYASGYYADSNATVGITSVSKPAKTGYTFGGYNNSSNEQIINGNGTITASNTKFTTNVFITAQWTANTYTIAFAGGTGATGSTASKTNVAYDSAVQLTANGFSKTGYTFAGWKVTNGLVTSGNTPQCGAADTLGTTVTADTVIGNSWYVKNLATASGATVTLTAQWTANTYTVKFNGNGATGGTMADQTYTYAAAQALRANAFTRLGYAFDKWNTQADGAGTSYNNQQSVSNLVSAAGGSITLYAQWIANSYSVTLQPNGGTFAGTTNSTTYTQSFGTNKVIGDPTRTGYTFVGWLPVVSYDNSDWIEVVYHYNANGTKLFDKNVDLAANVVNDNYKFSLLSQLGSLATNGTYEFILQYTDRNGVQRWSQTSNPATSTTVSGYTAISTGLGTSQGWAGLARSSSTGNTLIFRCMTNR